ncbi:MAG: hypothetical protein JNK15_16790 [Planctomycetes bacterium]|nr:hypothetical protein [Planctomycetota bacterium]
MTGEHEDSATGGDGTAPPRRLQAVRGPMAAAPEPPPRVKLVREWKGLTVADLLRDEIVERLPGQVRSALQHIDRGDYMAADRALPGDSSPILAGPGHRSEQRWLWVFLIGVATALLAFAVADLLGP